MAQFQKAIDARAKHVLDKANAQAAMQGGTEDSDDMEPPGDESTYFEDVLSVDQNMTEVDLNYLTSCSCVGTCPTMPSRSTRRQTAEKSKKK